MLNQKKQCADCLYLEYWTEVSDGEYFCVYRNDFVSATFVCAMFHGLTKNEHMEIEEADHYNRI